MITDKERLDLIIQNDYAVARLGATWTIYSDVCQKNGSHFLASAPDLRAAIDMLIESTVKPNEQS